VTDVTSEEIVSLGNGFHLHTASKHDPSIRLAAPDGRNILRSVDHPVSVRIKGVHDRRRFGHQDPEDAGAGESFKTTAVEPGGIRLAWSSTDAEALTFSLRLRADEHIYGLGERFNRLDQRGLAFDLWVQNGASGTRTYKPVPFLISSYGYGIAIESGRRVSLRIGDGVDPDSLTISVPDNELSIVIFSGDTLVDILGNYTAWIGRPPVPPQWVFAPWKSRDWRGESETTVREDIERQSELGIPCGVKLIDATWEPGYHSFTFDDGKYRDPHGLIDEIRNAGMRLVLWISPWLVQGTEWYDAAASAGYMIQQPGGGPYPHRLGNNPDWLGTCIDFTNPDAVSWWQGKLRSLLEIGVSGFKTDFGEQIPEDAVFHNGRTGAELHNLYPVLYNEATWAVVSEFDGILLARSAWAGSQQFPGVWAGDQSADFNPWSGLPSAIVAGLSAGMSGFPYWGSDVGGYFGEPDEEVFIRWTQFAALSPIMEAHGLGTREPWAMSERVVEIYRRFATLHNDLRPYTVTAAQKAAETGLPIMRAMPLLYPDHPEAHEQWVNYQYQFGDDLLVAPVYSWNTTRNVWFPPGTWIDAEIGETFTGPAVQQVPSPLEKLPLFVREDARIPLRAGADPASYGWHTTAGVFVEQEPDRQPRDAGSQIST
jgi:alpha-D-xyloside xylohydrolase